LSEFGNRLLIPLFDAVEYDQVLPPAQNP